MRKLHDSYPMQSHSEYLFKLLKYTFVYLGLNCPKTARIAIFICTMLRINYKAHAVALLRGFPPDKLMFKLRHRPCDAILAMMYYRLSRCDAADVTETNIRADYVTARLPPGVRAVGSRAAVKNYWLFPIVVVSIQLFILLNNLMSYIFIYFKSINVYVNIILFVR